MDREEYLEQIKDDIIEYVKENDIELFGEDRDIDWGARDRLLDDLWCEDSVTGNASGSHTFSSAKAHEYVQGASDIIREMVDEFGIDSATVADKFLNEEWEWFDVSIRCYLLAGALDLACDELQAELKEAN